jgi:hypothetical protein
VNGDERHQRKSADQKVVPDGTPKLEFLDEAGKVIYSLPNSSGAAKAIIMRRIEASRISLSIYKVVIVRQLRR